MDQVEITEINILKKCWEKLDEILQKILKTVTKKIKKTFVHFKENFSKLQLIVKMLRCDEVSMEICGNSTKKRN